MALFLMALVALCAAASSIVTLSWVVPAVGELYSGRKSRATEP